MIEIVQFSALDQNKFENVAPGTFYCWETDQVAVQQDELAIVIEGGGCADESTNKLFREENWAYGAVKRAE